ncbi:sulfotransferase family 2 domain-containing protein [Marinomonas shanghaiensis]|uniref:sulfotransferase family 2 domain-containing protein n=1 Tax=Marinomonas shanghaiensis TaxID=2202418 RepID=UPI003A8D4E5E
MLDYDKTQPLIFIHIPKTAGTSVRSIFEQWFGGELFFHYYIEALNEMPIRHNIFEKNHDQQAAVVYGHFNRRRNFGVEDYYPNAKQFITLLRDPLETRISTYFYLQKVAHGWSKYPEPHDPDLQNYLRNNKSVMLNFFPRKVTFENYKEIIEKYFIEIGVVENIELSMENIATKLQKPYNNGMLERLNVTERDQSVTEELRNIFIESNELEYTVYNYVKSNYFDINGKISKKCL